MGDQCYVQCGPDVQRGSQCVFNVVFKMLSDMVANVVSNGISNMTSDNGKYGDLQYVYDVKYLIWYSIAYSYLEKHHYTYEMGKTNLKPSFCIITNLLN